MREGCKVKSRGEKRRKRGGYKERKQGMMKVKNKEKMRVGKCRETRKAVRGKV